MCFFVKTRDLGLAFLAHENEECPSSSSRLGLVFFARPSPRLHSQSRPSQFAAVRIRSSPLSRSKLGPAHNSPPSQNAAVLSRTVTPPLQNYTRTTLSRSQPLTISPSPPAAASPPM
ncbi:unnamed protein product [Sphenostylis stenocarpa]|uniref:Uncharacterized protein n=1 Tax=Sphenostylis stenocarpa TaxID=92480 RepID=A0AA86S7U3_9FABA|nr:unnamed protein product [Sphenostylis stenocarpa]